MTRYSFVVDTRDPKVKKTISKAEVMLGEGLMVIETVSLPLGVTQISYVLSTETPELPATLIPISLSRLAFSLEGARPTQIQLYFLTATVKAMVKAELNVDVDVEEVRYDGLIRLLPKYNDLPLYVSDEESLTIRSTYLLDQLLGCAPVSDKWNTPLAVEELSLDNYQLKRFGKLFVLVIPPDISQDEVLEDLVSVRDTVDRMITDGYEYVADPVVEEIGAIWNLPVTGKSIRVPVEHPLKLHMDHSLLSVVMDGLPRIEIPVTFKVVNEEDLARLTFAAFLAYAEVAETHVVLKEFVDQLVVTALPSVLVSLFDQKQQEQLAIRLGSKLEEAAGWQVWRETNLEGATIRRFAIHRAHPYAKSMSVKVGGSEFAVTNLTGSSVSVAENEQEQLKQELIRYYQKVCHDEMDTVTYQRISEMSISELTRLVVTDDRPRYCFGYETATELPSAVNPVTQVPFSQKTKLRIVQSDAMARGLYGIGDILPGLMSISEPPKVTPPGDVTFFTVADEVMRYNITDIGVSFGESEEDLFDLALHRDLTDSDKGIVEQAWKSGSLLNPWARSALLAGSGMPRHFLQLDPILRDANDSSITGDRALSFLKQVT